MRFLILLAILETALAYPRSNQRIVGGNLTIIEQYPYLSSMQYGFLGISFSHSCGGSLLNEYFVLSASHCYLAEDLPSEWRVRLGSSFLSSGGDMHTVSQLINHPDFNNVTGNNDVAIIRLSSPANMNNVTIAAARIPSAKYYLHDNAAVTAIGWGFTSINGSVSKQLRNVQVRVVQQKICAKRYAYLKSFPDYKVFYIADDMVCAGVLDVGGKDACQGDSGGPLAQAGNIVVGITSWGHECANATYPGVYARVTYFSNWIQDVTK